MARLGLDIFATDKASATLGNVGSKIGATAGIATAAGSAILSGLGNAGQALISFAQESVDSAIAAEDSTNRLAFTWSKFGNVADTTVAQVDAVATALRDQSGISKSATRDSASLLAQFGLTGQQILDILPLIADYSRATGKDMTDATTAIGKALLGSGRALKDIGIDYENQGDAASNYTYLMGQLTQQVGGYADSWGKTTAGEMAKSDAQMAALKSTLGEQLLPLVKEYYPFVEAGLRTGVQWLKDFTRGLDEVKQGWDGIAAAWDAWYADFEAGIAVIKSWVDDFQRGLSTIGSWFSGNSSSASSISAAPGMAPAGGASVRTGGPVYNITVTSPFGVSPWEAGAHIVHALEQYERRNSDRWRQGAGFDEV